MDSSRQQARRRLDCPDGFRLHRGFDGARRTDAHGAAQSLSSVQGPAGAQQYLLVAFLTVPLMLSLVVVFGLHRQFERPFRLWLVTWDQIRLHLSTLVGIALIVFFTQVRLNRTIVGLFLVYTFVFMLGSRVQLDGWRRRSHAIGQDQMHLLIIGSDPVLVELVIDATRTEDLPPKLVGILESAGEPQRDRILNVPILGGLGALERVLHQETVDEVVLATRSLTPDRFAGIVAACDDLGTPMRQIVLPEFHDGRRLGLERQYGLPFVTLARTERSTEALAIKRAIDLLGVKHGAAAAFAGHAVRGGDHLRHHGPADPLQPGPHRLPRPPLPDAQVPLDGERRRAAARGPRGPERDGRPGVQDRGRPAHHAVRSLHPRVQPRRAAAAVQCVQRLDEPRRPAPVAGNGAAADLGPMRRRLSMKPGITGLWQVSGRSNLSFEEWMKMDLEYLDNWSNLEDIRLLVMTLPAVLAGRGAK